MLAYLIFDLDQTIYSRQSGLMQAISERISLYMIERLNMVARVDLRAMDWEASQAWIARMFRSTIDRPTQDSIC